MDSPTNPTRHAQISEMESRILDSTKTCIEHWGVSRFTVSDVCELAGVSRATLYRLFPGGKEILLEALHVRSLDEFFATLLARAQGATSLEQLLVRCIVVATNELRSDEHLALVLATEPGTTLTQFTVAGMPRTVRVASSSHISSHHRNDSISRVRKASQHSYGRISTFMNSTNIRFNR